MIERVKAEEFDLENANWENDVYHHDGNQLTFLQQLIASEFGG